MSNSKEEKLVRVEETFQKYLTRKIDEKTFCKDLGIILGSLDKYKYTVGISNENKKEPFYGMRIFPQIVEGSTNVYDYVLQLMMDGDKTKKVSFSECYSKWKDTNEWYLEIDASALDQNQINWNPRELTAMVLHEVGHVIYSSKPMERIYNAFMDMKVQQSYAVKATMSATTFLFYPVIIAACKCRNWRVGKNEQNIELFADKNAIQYGYGEDMISAFGKAIKFFGRTEINESIVDAEASYCAKAVAVLLARRNRVENELYVKAAQSSSNFIQGIYRKILMKLGLTSRDKYTGNLAPELPATESLFDPSFIMKNDLVYTFEGSIALETICNYSKNSARVALEAFSNNKKKKFTSTEMDDLQYDIDKIMIDADKITSHHDRVYVLDQIYEVKEELGEWEERIREFPHLRSRYAAKVERMQAELASLRNAILEKKNFDKRYEVFVKYPEGYEG